MNAKAREEDGRPQIVIETSSTTERWFLKQLMKHGASVRIRSNESWTTITLTGLTPGEAELLAIDAELKEGDGP